MCSVCGKGLAGNVASTQGKKYHVACFTCCKCAVCVEQWTTLWGVEDADVTADLG